MLLGVDTETTGLDTFHGCRPYLVTTCDDRGCQRTYQVPVDPKNRKIVWPESDISEIQRLLDSSDKLIFHNSKFDMKMMASIGLKVDHLWGKVEDTLFITHMLASQTAHDLTSVVKAYLREKYDSKYPWDGTDITPYEKKMEECVQVARRWCRSHLKDWKLASEGIEDENGLQLMPSTKGSSDKAGRAWMADTWLPRAVAEHEGPSWVKGHQYENWLTVSEEYADIDSSCLIPLYRIVMEEVRRRGLEKIYRERLKILPVVHRMEHYGTSYKTDTAQEMKKEFTERVQELEAICYGIAECYHYPLELPKRGRNKGLDAFIFDVLKLPVLEWGTPTKGKVYTSDKPFIPKPVFDADVKEQYELTLPNNSIEQRFIKALNEKSEYDTALGYLAAYDRFCIKDKDSGNYATLYPNLNPTGTVGLRFSHNNPNSANVSKQKKVNLRKCFGPREGRIWYSCDYTGIELAIPAYEAGETEMVKVFDNPDEGPYYGSYHLLIFDTLHHDIFKQHGKNIKQLYEDTLYQWVKNGNFARQYGAQEKKVDQTYRVKGAFKLISKRFPKIDALSRKYLQLAECNNCVTTTPDKFIDPIHGFPIQSKRGQWGKVEPTTPFCYHVSSTATQVLNRAMILCDEKLLEWRSGGYDAWMILTIHDELVFDLPSIFLNKKDQTYSDSRANELRTIMESAANGIGIPIKVSVERHSSSWADGEVVNKERK